jgi:hypothetical protein
LTPQRESMKKQYDFSEAERGKFFRSNAKFELPVYLEKDVRDYLTECARAKGVDVNKLINDLLKRDIALIEAAK